MKRIATIVSMVIMCGFMSTELNAQKVKSFSGLVTFSIKYEGDIDPMRLANAPKERIYTIAGNNTKYTVSGQGFVQHVVNIGDSSQNLMIIDHPMQKLVIKKDREDFEEDFEYVDIKVVPSDETKTICGYACKRYDIEVKDLEKESEIKVICYTTEEIGVDENINFETPGLKGYPLYQEQHIGEIKIITEAVKVKKKKIKPAEFLIPSGFEIISYDDYMEAVRASQNSGGGE